MSKTERQSRKVIRTYFFSPDKKEDVIFPDNVSMDRMLNYEFSFSLPSLNSTDRSRYSR